ncbi:MAG: efflux RND transporter permease subunit [Gammaproteobacteria bacterium]|nr:efflux RND transporter permease subunit [Gammaproteobacteria bacterium]
MKSFTDIFIHRPVFASVLSLLLLLVGIRAFFALDVRLFPNISPTVVTATVTYPGANSELMEGFVTTPIEEAIAGVDGLDYITSSSTQNTTSISAYFHMGYNIDTAVSDINAQISSVRYKLPQGIEDPVVKKEDPNTQPTLYISFRSESMSPEQLTDYLIRVIQPQLQTLQGVGKADILGAREYAMRIWLDPNLMAAHDITATDVRQAIETNNFQSPTGQIYASLQRFDIRAATDLKTQEQFNRMVIKNDKTNVIRLEDIGKAELGAKNTDFSVVMDGKQAIVVAITPRSTANPVDVSKVVLTQISKMKDTLPAGLHEGIMWNGADYINSSIHEVVRTIIEATLFVVIVVFLFLGSLRVLFVPVVTIPLSLIGVFGIMLALGYTINTLTLLALVLAIGMVVDDAIVVSENVHRHLAMGGTPFEAAISGAREIKFAVIAMTITLAAVYAPIGFITGLTGALFREFAFTLASTVIISGFIALTLSPMMCSKVMTTKALSGKLPTFILGCTDKLTHGYVFILHKVLKVRIIVILGLIVALIACAYLYMTLPQELAPKEDEGFVLTLITGPSAANLKYTEKYTKQLEKIYDSIPETRSYGIINGMPNGINTALSFLALKPWNQRTRSVDQLIQYMMPKDFAITGTQVYPTNPSSLPGNASFMPINFVLQTTQSYDYLNAAAQKLLAAVRKNQAILFPDFDLKIDKPQIEIGINRDKARTMGIAMTSIGNTLNIALGQPITTYFDMSGRSYQVIPQLLKKFRSMPTNLNLLNIRTESGELTPLSGIVNLSESIQPPSLNHFQELRSATLQASLPPGYTIGMALKYINQVAKNTLPKDIKIDLSGTSRQFVEESGKMTTTFIFAILFIYLVLAAQFESMRDPFIVMLTVPLSTLGALGVLHLIHGTLNIYSEIGIVTLIGLISKHGILMVEFANQLQEEGEEFVAAIIKSASVRLRPILMTTFAMILGALPLALASGAGAISRQQIGWTIVGGMTVGTLFTLFVVPSMYTYIAARKQVVKQPA